MASKLEIKNRIKSVDSTKKITRAMQLVAASKLRKCKERMGENKEYAKYLKETVDSILSSLDNLTHPYLVENDSEKVLSIIFTSDMGLCGAYNGNIFKLIESDINKSDPIIMLGGRGTAWAKRNGYEMSEGLVNVDDEGYEDIVNVANKALEMYVNGEVGKIQIIYTTFVNAVTFIPTKVTLLPVSKNEEEQEDENKVHVDTIFEPSGEEILDDLVPMYLKSLIYSYWLETKTSEQASRQTAMENATDNAEELRDMLELEYNKARQASITQEITEIVAGANAI